MKQSITQMAREDPRAPIVFWKITLVLAAVILAGHIVAVYL